MTAHLISRGVILVTASQKADENQYREYQKNIHGFLQPTQTAVATTSEEKSQSWSIDGHLHVGRIIMQCGSFDDSVEYESYITCRHSS